MDKIIGLPELFEHTGEPTASLFEDRGPLIKVANPFLEKLKGIGPERGKTKVLVIAMTDGHHYGPNNNGDFFSEPDLIKYHPTFVTMAKVFRQHVNKPGSPSYGEVIMSDYNPDMKRVELLLSLENSKVPDIVETIRNGGMMSVSMGCRLPFEVCSICSHKSPTLAHRCDHLKYQMNQVYEDGRRVCAINPGPLKFFDISIVRKPADKAAWMLKKVAAPKIESISCSASAGEKASELNSKVAMLDKMSEVLKRIEDGVAMSPESYKENIRKIKGNIRPISKKEREKLAQYPVDRLMGTLVKHGSLLPLKDLTAIICIKRYGFDPELEDKTPFEMAQPIIENPYSYEEALNEFGSLGIGVDLPIDPLIEQILQKTSIRPHYVLKRAEESMEKNAKSLRENLYDNSRPAMFDDRGTRKGNYDSTIIERPDGSKFKTNRASIRTGKNLAKFDDAVASSALAGLGVGSWRLGDHKKSLKLKGLGAALGLLAAANSIGEGATPAIIGGAAGAMTGRTAKGSAIKALLGGISGAVVGGMKSDPNKARPLHNTDARYLGKSAADQTLLNLMNIGTEQDDS